MKNHPTTPKAKIFLQFLLILVTLNYPQGANAQALSLWAAKGSCSGYDNASAVATDLSGNVYVAGSFQSVGITFGAFTLPNSGSNDVYLAKYNSIGSVVWAVSAGGGTDDNVYGVATDDSGCVYIAGAFRSSSLNIGSAILNNQGGSDIFVAKYDSSGNLIWARAEGGSTDDGLFSVDVDGLGNVYLAGTTISGGTDNIYFLKYDRMGNLLWNKNIGGNANDAAYSVACDNLNNTYIAGYFASSSVAFDSATTVTSAGANDIFLAKYDSAGNLLWAKSAGDSLNDGIYSLVLDSSANIYFTGYFASNSISFDAITISNSGSNDAFIAKYDSSGNAIWAKNGISAADDRGYSISIDGSANTFIVGYFYNSIVFGQDTLNSLGGKDAFMVKYNPAGNILWAKSITGSSDDEGYSISADLSGGIYLAGYSISSSVSFDTIILNNNGAADMFLAKYFECSPVITINPRSICDGGAYTINNHTYTEAGNYSDTLQSALACDSIVVTQLTVNYSALSGIITINGIPVAAGYVELYQSLADSIPLVFASTNINPDGTYAFSNIPTNQYLIRAVADSVIYPDAIPTYADSTHRWDISKIWTADCGIDTQNIAVINLIPPMQAGANINGFIWDDDTLPQRRPGEPIRGVGVVIQNNGSASYRAITDTNGFYSFANILIGNYDIYAEMPNGVMLNTYAVNVSDTGQNFNDLNFYVDSINGTIDTVNINNADTLFPTYLEVFASADYPTIKVYPLPVKSICNLNIVLSENEEVVISTQDISGRILIHPKTLSAKRGDNTFIIDSFSGKPPGIYILRINSKSINTSVKILKD